MVHLTHLRNRIKTVMTLKKTTNAMRLIAMSTHMRLRQQKEPLTRYRNELERLSNAVCVQLQAHRQTEQKELIKKNCHILVGSHKGLCGAFNSMLESFFSPRLDHNSDYITIGTHATNYVQNKNIQPLVTFNVCTSATFITIADEICTLLLKNNYTHVSLFSMHSRTFLVQYPKETIILPHAITCSVAPELLTDEYEWEIPAEEMWPILEQLQIKTTLQELLFDSLLSEQAARFVSMDTATRNAEDMLEEMKRDYNKLRQAAITKELTDLTSSFSALE